jgi:hypothetical protein
MLQFGVAVYVGSVIFHALFCSTAQYVNCSYGGCQAPFLDPAETLVPISRTSRFSVIVGPNCMLEQVDRARNMPE